MTIRNKPKYIEVTVQRAAQLKKVSVRTMQRWCDERKLLSIRNYDRAPYRIFLPEDEYESMKSALRIPSDSIKSH
jgi:hypothetical protein